MSADSSAVEKQNAESWSEGIAPAVAKSVCGAICHEETRESEAFLLLRLIKSFILASTAYYRLQKQQRR